MTNILIKTKGMHCQSCETLIKDALQEMGGVNFAEADFKKGTVKVSFNESKIGPVLIKEIIKKEGYRVD